MTGNPNGGVGSVVSYKCNANYKLVGSAERKCLTPNSAWTGTAAKCAPIDCGNFPKPEGGGLSRNDGTVGLDGEHTTVGARAIVSCLAHHKLIRTAGDRRTCLANGAWSGDSGKCVQLMCPPLGKSGTLTVKNHATAVFAREGGTPFDPAGEAPFGSTVQFACMKGYVASGGSAFRKCTSDGKVPKPSWSGTGGNLKCTCKIDAWKPWSACSKTCGGGAKKRARVIHGHGCGLVSDETAKCNVQACPVCDVSGVLHTTKREKFTAVQVEGGDHDRAENAKITFKCSRGYEQAGGDRTRTCKKIPGSLTAAALTGDDFSCQMVTCGAPPTVKDATMVPASGAIKYQTVVVYTCGNGYTMSKLKPFRRGDDRLTCGADGKYHGRSTPKCAPVDCGPPTEHKPGTYAVARAGKEGGASTSRVLGAIVRFTCPKGFNQHGPEQRECLAAGSWGGADPSCVTQSCGTPKAPAANGKVSAPKGHTVGESAAYSCDTGYQLTIGGKKVPDVKISCEAVTKAAPGTLGTWSDPAPTCTIRTCGTLPPVEVTGPDPVNGQSKTKVPTRKGTTGRDGKADTFGATATLGCGPGYDYEGASTIACLATGAWSSKPGKCVIKDCGAQNVAIPGNGKRTGAAFTFGASVQFKCNTGFVPAPAVSGDTKAYTRTCGANGKWTGEDFRCPPKECKDPGAVPFAARQVIHDPKKMTYKDEKTKLTFKEEVTWTCVSGYKMNVPAHKTRQCTETGDWTGTKPVCVKQSCGVPGGGSTMKIPKHTNLVGRIGMFDYGTSYTFRCDSGYHATKPGDVERQIKCVDPERGLNPANKDRAVWSGVGWTGKDLLVCTIADCTDKGVAPPTFGTRKAVTINSKTGDGKPTTFGSVVSFQCNTGYTLSGSKDRTCQASAEWSGSAPTCEPVQCPVPDKWLDARATVIKGSEFFFPKEIVIVCDKGHEFKHLSVLHGNAQTQVTVTRTCQATGKWASTNPASCRPISCGGLAAPSNGQVGFTAKHLFPSVATFACDGAKGYQMVGSKTSSCLSTGKWSSKVPECARKPIQITDLNLAQRTDKRVVARWKAPSSDKPITHYVVEYTDAATSRSYRRQTKSAATSFEVDGLPENSNLAFSVAAVSMIGEGVQSKVVDAKTCGSCKNDGLLNPVWECKCSCNLPWSGDTCEVRDVSLDKYEAGASSRQSASGKGEEGADGEEKRTDNDKRKSTQELADEKKAASGKVNKNDFDFDEVTGKGVNGVDGDDELTRKWDGMGDGKDSKLAKYGGFNDGESPEGRFGGVGVQGLNAKHQPHVDKINRLGKAMDRLVGQLNTEGNSFNWVQTDVEKACEAMVKDCDCGAQTDYGESYFGFSEKSSKKTKVTFSRPFSYKPMVPGIYFRIVPPAANTVAQKSLIQSLGDRGGKCIGPDGRLYSCLLSRAQVKYIEDDGHVYLITDGGRERCLTVGGQVRMTDADFERGAENNEWPLSPTKEVVTSILVTDANAAKVMPGWGVSSDKQVWRVRSKDVSKATKAGGTVAASGNYFAVLGPHAIVVTRIRGLSSGKGKEKKIAQVSVQARALTGKNGVAQESIHIYIDGKEIALKRDEADVAKCEAAADFACAAKDADHSGKSDCEGAGDCAYTAGAVDGARCVATYKDLCAAANADAATCVAVRNTLDTVAKDTSRKEEVDAATELDKAKKQLVRANSNVDNVAKAKGDAKAMAVAETAVQNAHRQITKAATVLKTKKEQAIANARAKCVFTAKPPPPPLEVGAEGTGFEVREIEFTVPASGTVVLSIMNGGKAADSRLAIDNVLVQNRLTDAAGKLVGQDVTSELCAPKDDSQLWTLDDEKNQFQVTMEDYKDTYDLCLFAPTPTVLDTALKAVPCDDTNKKQQWDVVDIDEEVGTYVHTVDPKTITTEGFEFVTTRTDANKDEGWFFRMNVHWVAETTSNEPHATNLYKLEKDRRFSLMPGMNRYSTKMTVDACAKRCHKQGSAKCMGFDFDREADTKESRKPAHKGVCTTTGTMEVSPATTWKTDKNADHYTKTHDDYRFFKTETDTQQLDMCIYGRCCHIEPQAGGGGKDHSASTAQMKSCNDGSFCDNTPNAMYSVVDETANEADMAGWCDNKPCVSDKGTSSLLIEAGASMSKVLSMSDPVAFMQETANGRSDVSIKYAMALAGGRDGGGGDVADTPDTADTADTESTASFLELLDREHAHGGLSSQKFIRVRFRGGLRVGYRAWEDRQAELRRQRLERARRLEEETKAYQAKVMREAMEVAQKLAKKRKAAREAARLAGGKSAPTPVADTGTDGQTHGLWTNDNGYGRFGDGGDDVHGCAKGTRQHPLSISKAECFKEARLQTFFLDEKVDGVLPKKAWKSSPFELRIAKAPKGCVMATKGCFAYQDHGQKPGTARYKDCEGTVFWNTHPTDVELQGGNDHTATNLQACIGECDGDGQCAAGLKCFQRDGYTAIPGCKGKGTKDWDYCYRPSGGKHYKSVHGPGAKYPQKRCYAPTKVYKTFSLKGKKHSRVKIKMDIWNVGNVEIDGRGFEVKIFAGERLGPKFSQQGDGKIPKNVYPIVDGKKWGEKKNTVAFFTPWWGQGTKKPWKDTAMVEHQMRAEKTFNYNGNPGASYQSIETEVFAHFADTLEVRIYIH